MMYNFTIGQEEFILRTELKSKIFDIFKNVGCRPPNRIFGTNLPYKGILQWYVYLTCPETVDITGFLCALVSNSK